MLRGLAISLLVAVIAIGLTACGQAPADKNNAQPGQATSTETDSSPAYDAGPPPDWDNLIGGIPVEDSSTAEATLPFTVIEPKDMGVLLGTFVATSSDSPGASTAIQFVYDSNVYGRLVVVEHVSDMPDVKSYEQYMEAMAALNGTPDLHGTAEIVSLPDGGHALFETSPDGSYASIYWYVESLAGNFEVMVFGPQLGKEQGIAIAESLQGY